MNGNETRRYNGGVSVDYRYPSARINAARFATGRRFFLGVEMNRRKNPGAPRWILRVVNFLREWNDLFKRFNERGGR